MKIRATTKHGGDDKLEEKICASLLGTVIFYQIVFHFVTFMSPSHPRPNITRVVVHAGAGPRVPVREAAGAGGRAAARARPQPRPRARERASRAHLRTTL